jgi:hypothetical protein
MVIRTPRTDVRPFLHEAERLSGQRTRELIDAVRAAGGREILARRFSNVPSAAPAATRMRETLGTDFYVRRSGGDLWVRARRAGEPPLRHRKLKLGPDWMTMAQAAEALGVTTTWFRDEYVKSGRVEQYRFGTRLAYKRAAIEELAARRRKR